MGQTMSLAHVAYNGQVNLDKTRPHNKVGKTELAHSCVRARVDRPTLSYLTALGLIPRQVENILNF